VSRYSDRARRLATAWLVVRPRSLRRPSRRGSGWRTAMRAALPLRAAPAGRLSLRLALMSAPRLPRSRGLACRAAAICRRAPSRGTVGLPGQRAVRCAAARLAFQRALGGAAAPARDWARVDAACAYALAGALALAGERHPGAARLGKADGDRLLGRAGAVF